jgi:peptide/nickel transport system ATP-binding protein
MTRDAGKPVLAIDGLTITAPGGRAVVSQVGLSLQAGEIGALIGESGSGKTTIGRAVLRLLSPALTIAGGTILFEGQDLVGADAATLRSLRGRRMAAVFQEPMTSLNPSMTVGRQMMEALRLHEGVSAREAKARSLEMLHRVRISDPARCFDEYPGKFSGGMRQRFMLASVLLTRPALLIADEPTTALDALIRREIMEQMVELTRELGTAVLLVSHDLGMVSQYADSATVLHDGLVVEQGQARRILLDPRTDYMRRFVAALPSRPAEAHAEVADATLVGVSGLNVAFPLKRPLLFGPRRHVRAVKDASFDIRRGEVLAVVGESGSGKTTVGRTLLGLHRAASGAIEFGTASAEGIQMIFQDSYSSLDPQMTIERIVAEPLRHDARLTRDARLEQARQMLREVGLAEPFFARYPHELSGGQRQRVGIARAIVAQPALVVADEPVSALDASVQRQVLDLLMRLKQTYDLSYLFISHDLGVVEEIADRVIVMYRGRIVEAGPREAIFDRPRHPYTHQLLEATPRIVRRAQDHYELVVAPTGHAAAPSGFAYHQADDDDAAEMVDLGGGHHVLCSPRADFLRPGA